MRSEDGREVAGDSRSMYVGLTDQSCSEFLRLARRDKSINFWRPGPRHTPLRRLPFPKTRSYSNSNARTLR